MTTAAPSSTANAVAPAPTRAEDALRQVEEAERQMVLAAFEELKRRDAGELRVAIRLNRETSVREIVYLGIHEQRSLDRLRKLYSQLRQPNGGKALRF